ncbi:SpoU rRNA Methylase family protein [Pseudarcicella hirudinis]|uniref:SpoU rRNA Methylase family protein n=1 Tax=Pseudarcicella hirudinis TaxID=1079859 RepID=A0A1I5S3W4_9BACT|nr:RNA methyltransferase [Pseudarcicella hirudinis]SFP65379.1 SpoU rRNA Methylase family protein [Pseudarcicella hirudinis]
MRKLQMDELNRLTIDEFKSVEKFPYVLILDDIRSMNNVGSAFRTADAFKCEKIYLCGITGLPPHREITKTALGADETVAWEHAENVVELVEQLQKEGYIIMAVEQVENSMFLNEFEPESEAKYAFVFGNEVFGVNDEVVKKADICLEIPQFGTKHSLNIAVSLGIVSWDFVAKKLKK